MWPFNKKVGKFSIFSWFFFGWIWFKNPLVRIFEETTAEENGKLRQLGSEAPQTRIPFFVCFQMRSLRRNNQLLVQYSLLNWNLVVFVGFDRPDWWQDVLKKLDFLNELLIKIRRKSRLINGRIIGWKLNVF